MNKSLPQRINFIFSTLLLACALGSGCASPDSERFQVQVHHWVPLGTPVADAQRIMEHHKFDCKILEQNPDDPTHSSTLSCTRRPSVWSTVGNWQAEFVIENGKVTDYGYIDL